MAAAMPRPAARRTLTRFRVVLMLALVAAVGAVVALYLFGAAGAPRPRRAGGGAPEIEEGTRMVGKDFDYTFSQGEKSVFRVRGNSIRVDKDDTVYLDSVGLTLFDKEGRRFDAESQEASINRTTNEGRLWGDVSIKGPSQLEIHSNQLLIQSKGNLLVTPGVARILYAGRYFARCDSLQAWLPDEVYSMIGNVRIETFPEIQPRLSLEAGKAMYERKRRQLHVEENAELHRGPAKLDADRLTGLLSDDETSLTFVRALYHVSGETAESEAPGTTRTSWEGNDLAVQLAPRGNLVRRIDLEGTPGKPARLHAAGNAVTRHLVAPHIEGLLADKDVLRSASADGGVDLEEVGPPKAEPGAVPAAARSAPPARGGAAAGNAAGRQGVPVVRRAHGSRGDATFRPDGQIAGATLLDQVTYGDGEVNATGDRAVMDMDAGRGEFFGKPVHVVSQRGEMRAPHVIYTSADQLVHAVEGVHAVIQQANDANLAGGVLGEGKGPVTVESLEAFWQRPQASFVFRGNVRSWRGDNILLAPVLVGERLPQGDQLAASGGVQTVWIPGAEESGPAAGGGGAAAATGGSKAGPPAANPKPAAPANTRAVPGSAGGRAAAPAGPKPGPAAAQARPTAPAASKGGGGPVTVLATSMLYRDGSGVLTYSGNVHVDQDGKTLSCKQLDVNLDKDHKARQMNCTGGTHLDDPAAGRKIDGETGVYRLETRKIDIFGDPVIMRDRDGNLVHGKRLRYAVDDGKVEVLGKDQGRPPAPAAPAAAGPAPAGPAAPGSGPTAAAPSAPAPAPPPAAAGGASGAATLPATPGGASGAATPAAAPGASPGRRRAA
jgi:lipopolysaccharide transport protein LptA